MSDVKEKFINRMEALRSAFEAKLGERLNELEAVIGEMNTVNSSVGMKKSLEKLHTLSHKLRGAASTFGFSHVAGIAQVLEQLSVDGLKDIAVASPDNFLEISDLVKSLRVIHDFGDKTSIVEGASWQIVLEELGTRKELDNTIFIVDDDLPMVELLEEQLTLFGFTVKSITNLSHLPREVETHPPAAILMDIMFPGEEDAGVLAIQALKEKELLSCPVIFLSVRGDFKARLGAVRAGCDGFLVKPVDIIELVDTLNRLTKAPVEFAYRVLVVDDDADVAERNALLLSEAGMEVKVVSDPMSVMATIREIEPDAILMDINMPDCNGFELATVIRQDRKFLQIPIIFLTAEGGVERQFSALRSGADEFLEKSAKPDYLVASVLARAKRSRIINALISRLKESETRFRAVAQTAVDAIVSVDQKGRIIFWNSAAQSIFGYAPSEILGKPFTLIVAESSHPTLGTSFQQAKLKEGKSLVGNITEMEGLKKDNSKVPIEISLAEWTLGEGTFLSAIIRDITDRKEIEGEILRLNKELENRVVERTEALRESEKLLRTVFEAIPNHIYVKDKKGVYQMANREFLEYWGVDADKISGFKTGDLSAGNEKLMDFFLESDQKVLETGESLDEIYEFESGDGHKTIRRQIKVPHKNDLGEIIGIIGLSEDVTLQKRAEEELRQAQKMEAIGQLTGGVAHDFNNILQIISGHSQIARSINKDHKVLEHLDVVVQATQRAADLTQQLLAFSRQQMHRPQTLDINDVITHFVKMLSRVFGENIDLQLKLAGEPIKIYADPSMLEQVLLNLCVNSRDAMPNGGKLTISTEAFEAGEDFLQAHSWAESRAYVRISVIDTGEGMPPEVLEKIFEPFFTTKAAGKGTGLGLSMAYGIIQQHGGKIMASSDVGKGTTFEIYLPVEAGDQELNIEEHKNEDAPGGTETILIAEDEEGVLLLLTELLGEKGYTVLTSTNGIEALKVLDEKKDEIDLILLDVIMPEMGGREVFEKIKHLQPSTPVIFSTGYNDHQLDEKFLQDHKLIQISKPFSPNELFQAIRQSLEQV
ncbi:MAG: response regulator [SAR324 cluster bacterium]|nr:response regulator [SAR324 cluster bacterium]MCH8885693.1 response regulator [SAR324 cluster bacterium]